MKCWSSSLLVHLKDLIPKRMDPLTYSNKVLLEIHFSTFQLKQVILNVDISLECVLRGLLWWDCFLFFQNGGYSFWNERHFTWTEHRPVQYPLCLCLFTLTSTLIKEFVFVDWISVSVCKYVYGSQFKKAYSLLQQQIHQP